MSRVRDIDPVVLRVRAPQPMLDLYGGVLGGTVAPTQDEIGLVQLRAGRALLPFGRSTRRSGRAAATATRTCTRR